MFTVQTQIFDHSITTPRINSHKNVPLIESAELLAAKIREFLPIISCHFWTVTINEIGRPEPLTVYTSLDNVSEPGDCDEPTVIMHPGRVCLSERSPRIADVSCDEYYQWRAVPSPEAEWLNTDSPE